MIERIHLAIIREVDRQGSLTAAAGALSLTQSTLSHTMRKFEKSLGTDIWVRENRCLRLTQAGQYLLAVANRLLPQLDQAENLLHQYAIGERGTLHIGMTEGHPAFIANSGRGGFDDDEYLAYAPESGATFSVLWIAVARAHAEYSHVGHQVKFCQCKTKHDCVLVVANRNFVVVHIDLKRSDLSQFLVCFGGGGSCPA